MKAVSMNLSIFFISGMPEYAREYSGISSIQLCGGQFDKLVESIGQTVDVASSGSCESRLSATATLDQLGGFADVLSGVPALGDKVEYISMRLGLPSLSIAAAMTVFSISF